MPSFTYAECISNGWNPYLSSLAILNTFKTITRTKAIVKPVRINGVE